MVWGGGFKFYKEILRKLRYNINIMKIMMRDKTIERVEEKYLLTRSEKTALMKAVRKYLERDEYYKEEVLSLYFDTKNYDLAIKSIDRPDFREKVRVRAYDVPKRSSRVFFEVKTKFVQGKRKIGDKRRLSVKLGDFYKYLDKGESLERIADKSSRGDAQQLQVARELDYMMKHYRLEPKVVVTADRVAFKGKEDAEFRLTFDENLRFREDELRLEKGSRGEKYFPAVGEKERAIIMEVKTMRAMPPWFVAELSRLRIYPVRFSKYGKIYQLIQERKKNV